MGDASAPVVLVVDDEPDVATSFEMGLPDHYEVRIANAGAEALEQLDGVDVVLLDRMMPGMSGDEVLAEIRERGVDCRVAMVTAVDPDFEVVDMGFDAYVSKPPARDELRETIDRLLERRELDDDLQEYYSLVARRSALEAEYSQDQLDERDDYAELVDRIENHREHVDESLDDLDDDAVFVGAVSEVVDQEDVTESAQSDDGRSN